jgi:protocatechuate 3,4-dioxygenase beta subunit
MTRRIRQTRREFLGTSLATSMLALVPGAAARERVAQPTPACGDTDFAPTQMAGPFFKPSSPRRVSFLEPGITGTRIVVTGVVLSARCQPIGRALLDFWQADDRGQYDTAGYRLRGHQFTDEAGRYRLETIVPGLYPGRTRHLHVNVKAPDQPVLTTQLYFPDEPQNPSDWIFNPALVLAVEEQDGGKVATFDFVLDDELRRNRAPRRG